MSEWEKFTGHPKGILFQGDSPSVDFGPGGKYEEFGYMAGITPILAGFNDTHLQHDRHVVLWYCLKYGFIVPPPKQEKHAATL